MPTSAPSDSPQPLKNDLNHDAALLAALLAGAWLYLAAALATLSIGLDGAVYAGIARLLAAGEGSFWYLPYFDAALASFHDHPPLGIWLQGQWFALWGNAFWVENLWCAMLTLCVIGLTASLWHTVDDAHTVWWPVLILLLMPVATRALKNNTLESLVTILALAAVWLAWLGRSRGWANLLVGAVCFAAALVKGPAAVFPLAAPGVLALIVERSLAKACKHSALALSVFTALALALWASPAAESIARYLEGQVFASLSGERLIDHGRLYQLGQLSVQLGIAAGLTLMAWMSTSSISLRREAFAMMAIGLCGSLPLLISPRQYSHYLLPSLPFFAIGFALLVRPRLPAWPRAVIWSMATLLMTLGTARFIWHFGSLGQDADELQSTLRVAEFATRTGSETAYYCSPLPVQQAYLLRHHGVRSQVADHEDWIVCAADSALSGWRAQEALPDGLAIWQRTR